MKIVNEKVWEDASDPLCSGCFAPLSEGENTCRECGTPRAMFSTIDPLRMGFAEGRMVHLGTGRLARIVLVGMWLIFFPSLLIGLRNLFDSLSLPLYFLIPGVLLLVFYGVILWKVTRNFCRRAFKVSS